MDKASATPRDTALAIVYFTLSTVITWWFIVTGKALYADTNRMLLSCSIAGGKWALQILAAFLLLPGALRWQFLRRIGAVCLCGSLILLPFCFTPVQQLLGESGFLYSLVASVLMMILLYYRAVRRSGISAAWFWAWIGCLAMAVSLQLTVVFHVL